MWRRFPHVLTPCSSLTPSSCTLFNLYFACFISSYSFLLFVSFWIFPSFFCLFAWLCIFPYSSPYTLLSLYPPLRLLLSISQSRIPGTVIPLCSAQCERMFNTTRTPGEETGKETDTYTHLDTHCDNNEIHPSDDPHQFLTSAWQPA